jgi:ferredoxin
MKNRLAEKLKKIHTGHVWANTRNCQACWECVDGCPKQVIGKVGFLWHKHIVFKNSENCSGCQKCLQTCPHGVFSETMPDIEPLTMLKEKLKDAWPYN